MRRATYSVGQLARMSGVSVRTLHHFETLGLLRPGRKSNGYRVYVQQDVERLQQILLYRACGFELGRIRQIIDGASFDACAALHAHLAELMQRRDQLDVLIDTVQKTLDTMEGDTTMTNEERFEGLKRAAVEQNEKTYGAEARERFGGDVVDAANRRLLAMDKEAWNNMNKLEDTIIAQLSHALQTGDVQSAESQELAAMHARWIELHWGEGAYTAEAHRQLARGYLADDRFRMYYDGRAGAGATEFLVAVLERWL